MGCGTPDTACGNGIGTAPRGEWNTEQGIAEATAP
jgi:hypothetical protein